jgi:hypothetical protein
MLWRGAAHNLIAAENGKKSPILTANARIPSVA